MRSIVKHCPACGAHLRKMRLVGVDQNGCDLAWSGWSCFCGWGVPGLFTQATAVLAPKGAVLVHFRRRATLSQP